MGAGALPASWIHQQPRPLLPRPARHHRLEHRDRLIQMRNPRHQNQMTAPGTTTTHPQAVNINATMTMESYHAPGRTAPTRHDGTHPQTAPTPIG